MREERASPPDLCAASAKEYKTTMPQPKDDMRPYLSLTIKTSDLAVAVHLAVRKHRLYGIRGFKVWGFNGTDDDYCRVDVRNVDHEAEETVAKWLSERELGQYKPGFGYPEGTLLLYSSHTPIEDNKANRQAIINEVKEIMNKPIMGIVGAPVPASIRQVRLYKRCEECAAQISLIVQLSEGAIDEAKTADLIYASMHDLGLGGGGK